MVIKGSHSIKKILHIKTESSYKIARTKKKNIKKQNKDMTKLIENKIILFLKLTKKHNSSFNFYFYFDFKINSNKRKFQFILFPCRKKKLTALIKAKSTKKKINL